MNGRRAGLAAAGAGAAAVLLAACGVPTTGVVDVGVPAQGLPRVPAARSGVVVYFLDGGQLRAVPGPVADGGDPVTVAMDLLFAGPAAMGRPDLRTRLPWTQGPTSVQTQGHTVTVLLPATVPELDAEALRQVVCTVAAAFPGADPASLQPVSGGAGPGPGETVPAPTTTPLRVDIRGIGWHQEQTNPPCPSSTPS